MAYKSFSIAIRPLTCNLSRLTWTNSFDKVFNICRTSASCAVHQLHGANNNIQKIVEMIAQKTSNNQTMQQNMNQTNCPSIVGYLLSLNVSNDTIMKTFETQPRLSMFPAATWRAVIDVMVKNGASLDTSISILAQCPALLQASSEKIMNSFDNLRSFGLDESSVLSLIKAIPNILFTENVKQIQGRIGILKKIFLKSDIEKLIERSPIIFVENWYDVEMKIHYILFKMGLDQRHIVRTGVLNHSLEHIKLRHKFLEKAGIYKFPGYKSSERIKTNTKLGMIVNSSDSEFIRKAVPGLMIEELLAFKDLSVFENDEDDDDEDDELAGDIIINNDYDSE